MIDEERYRETYNCLQAQLLREIAKMIETNRYGDTYIDLTTIDNNADRCVNDFIAEHKEAGHEITLSHEISTQQDGFISNRAIKYTIVFKSPLSLILQHSFIGLIKK